MGDYKAAENRYKNVEGTGFYRHCIYKKKPSVSMKF